MPEIFKFSSMPDYKRGRMERNGSFYWSSCYSRNLYLFHWCFFSTWVRIAERGWWNII